MVVVTDIKQTVGSTVFLLKAIAHFAGLVFHPVLFYQTASCDIKSDTALLVTFNNNYCSFCLIAFTTYMYLFYGVVVDNNVGLLRNVA